MKRNFPHIMSAMLETQWVASIPFGTQNLIGLGASEEDAASDLWRAVNEAIVILERERKPVPVYGDEKIFFEAVHPVVETGQDGRPLITLYPRSLFSIEPPLARHIVKRSVSIKPSA